ncbi:hypothetical protein Trydic_g14702 [Trypoxylus dichotomus]
MLCLAAKRGCLPGSLGSTSISLNQQDIEGINGNNLNKRILSRINSAITISEMFNLIAKFRPPENIPYFPFRL